MILLENSLCSLLNQRGKVSSGYFKKAVYEITMDKTGYDKQTILLEGQVTGWYLGGNVLFGGLIGWFIVDPASGAMWRLEPSYVSATLSPNKTASVPEGSGN